MSDVLIRDVPESVLSAIDARATRLGLSRSEFIRRGLAQLVHGSTSSVTASDLERFSSVFEHRAASIQDLMVAATGEFTGLTVLHQDRDFDLIASTTGQPAERL